MSDFDDLATAVDDAARATVAPPFPAIERRARARRHRQLAGATLALAALLTAGALAAPGGGPRSMEPAGPTPTGTRPTEEPLRCANGQLFDPARPCGAIIVPPGDDGAEDAGTTRCWDPAEPGTAGSRTIGTGKAGRTTWWVVAWTGKEGTNCVGWVSDPPVEVSWQMDADNDSGPTGALKPVLSREGIPVKGAADWEWMLYWGAVPPEVVRIELVDKGRIVGTLKLVDGGDRKYVAGTVQAPDERHGVPVAYDAQGRRVDIPDGF
ncbi:MAG TPA: hypothetical protein VNQ77_00670 [Frankiaceae bacterium]|nr:hypothetical protein [Frankiaceae bacterium]